MCRTLQELAGVGEDLHLALGVFDGVHVGHQAVIARAVEAAKREGGLAGLLTFDPHPIEVMAPAKAPRSLLATLDHKARIVAGLGVDVLIPLAFDRELAELEAESFIGRLMAARVKTLAVGEDWRFGHHRKGDVDLLNALAAVHGYRLEAVAPVMFEGDRISSTRIRQAIRDGNLKVAREMLGRPYSMRGVVVEGRRLGRDLGFPTANVEVGRRQLPPAGVWVVKVRIGDEAVMHAGVANLGVRPTVDGATTVLEVHLLDYQGDLYGKEIEVVFGEYLRAEQAFSSVEELARQIALDVERARGIAC